MTSQDSAGTGVTTAEGPPGGAGVPVAVAQRSGAQRLGIAGWARWGWHQLTSMRTALVLLFLLALASVPGSVLPQEGIDPQAVQQYYTAHPALAPWLARFSLFDVFGAPWFAAVYLLLFASLAGCVIPRAYRMARSAGQPPPRAPRNLVRLPLSASRGSTLPPEQALAAAATVLAGKRFRVRTGDGWVSAEKGYLREVGNLLFHLALLGVLVSVGLGGLFGYKADRLLVDGQGFANTVTSLDVFHPGRLVSASDLQPFSMTLDRFDASYVTSGIERGQPASFHAFIRYSAAPGSPTRPYDLRVNHPLSVDGVKVFLIGHGYAPVFRVTDGTGRVVFDGPVPFIPVDPGGMTSEGVVKVPDARPRQLGFAGVFLPTAVDIGGKLSSAFPAAYAPAVSLVSYAGNLGMNSGPPQSVYQLDTAGLHKLPVHPAPLAPGRSLKLPGSLGTLTFTGYRQWVSLAITYDPGQVPALLAAIAALAGLVLSFIIRRRRVFVRAHAAEGGGTLVEVGGLARTEAADGFETEFAGLVADLAAAVQDGPQGPRPVTTGRE
ncbi:MAG TPA: cytochrome c biogenesis protein ResB [Streptosporangiaceae bacterium]|nr:cytochrome c biogenesis protein ResB [Streptosporangiaceae bacterium]